jgi:hypothetical protein
MHFQGTLNLKPATHKSLELIIISYLHHLNDVQVSCVSPLHWVKTPEPSHNFVTPRNGINLGQLLDNPLYYPPLPLLYTLSR